MARKDTRKGGKNKDGKWNENKEVKKRRNERAEANTEISRLQGSESVNESAPIEKGGSIFLGLEKYLHAPPTMESFVLGLSSFFFPSLLDSARTSTANSSSLRYRPSPVSIFPSFTVRNDFRAPPLFFQPPPHRSFFFSHSFILCSFVGVLASMHREIWILRPVCIVWDLCLPQAHTQTRENLLERYRAGARVCACGCLLAGGDKDRSWRGVAGAPFGWKNRETRRERERERSETNARCPAKRWYTAAMFEIFTIFTIFTINASQRRETRIFLSSSS